MFDVRHSQTRLYDLRNDPGEMHDIAASHPAQRDALMGTIAEWWSRQINYYKDATAGDAFYAPGAPIVTPLVAPVAAPLVAPVAAAHVTP
jgi:hypothetical protein